MIDGHHVPLSNERQHHGFPGDPAGGNSVALLRLVLPSRYLQRPRFLLQWQSSRSIAVVVAIWLVLFGPGLQSASISLLSDGAGMARVAPPEQTQEHASVHFEGYISEFISV